MGLLDGAMRGVVSLILNLLVDNGTTLTRRTTVYNPLTDAATPTDVTISVKTSPPQKYKAAELNDSILRGDMKIYISAKELDALSFDVIPSTEAIVFATIGGINFSVVDVDELSSGDQAAAFLLQLRR